MKKYILKYKYHIFTIILYSFFLFQMLNVNMYADTYATKDTATMPNTSLIKVIYYSLRYHFTSWSGRLIGTTIWIILLRFHDLILFQLLNPLMLFLFCFLIYKIINLITNTKDLKLFTYISLICIGLNIKITRDTFYWLESTTLYVWGYILVLLLIYIIFKIYKEKRKLNTKEFILCLTLIIASNFIQESITIVILGLLFFYIIHSIINKNIDKKIVIILLVGVLTFICTYFIPGNQNRISFESGTQTYLRNLNFLQNILYRLNYTLTNTFFNTSICYYIFFTSIILSMKILSQYKNNKKIYILSIISIICNILFCITSFVISKYNIFITINYFLIIQLLYIVLNLYFMIILLKKGNILLFYLILSSLAASLMTIYSLLICHGRYFTMTIVALIIFNLYMYIYSNNKEKTIILLLASLLVQNIIIAFIFVISFILFKIITKNNLEYTYKFTLILFILSNLFTFIITLKNYYENDKIFEYNIQKIEQIKDNENSSTNNTITLKKLKYELYAWHMPENEEYTLEWYKTYYDIQDYEIIWIP